MHFDDNNAFTTLVNTGLTLIRKDGVAPPIGGGSFNGYKPIFRGCTFNGGIAPACHTQTNSNGDYTQLIVENSQLPAFRLGSVGGYGNVEAVFNNNVGVIGVPTIQFWYSNLRNNGYWKFNADRNEFTVLGGGNKNFSIQTLQAQGEALCFEALNNSTQLVISGTAVEPLFGNYKTVKGGGRINSKIIGAYEVKDQQSGTPPYSTANDVIQMWKRLGDCSTVNKTITVNSQTYTFTDNYLITKESESSIISKVNLAINNAVLKKELIKDCFDNIKLAEKSMSNVLDLDSILKYELVEISANGVKKCLPNSIKCDGIAVDEGCQGELIQVWTAGMWLGLPDGNYGVGADYKLDITAVNKVGYVVNGIFYFN